MKDRFIFFFCFLTLLQTQLIHAEKPFYGFTPFPYDFTFDAVNKVNKIATTHASIYAVHLDQCLPWKQILDNKPMPKWLTNDLKNIKSKIPKNLKVYIAFAPSHNDRKTLAHACGNEEGTERMLPKQISGKGFDDPVVIQAYTDYIKQVIQIMKPDYINIGIEMGDLAQRHPNEWKHFEKMYNKTFDLIKNQYPDIKIGMEYVLQGLMKPSVAKLVKPTVNKSDYIGISFYPYASSYGVLFNSPPLKAPPEQWREPLKWLKKYTNKPIAICETGYITSPLIINAYNLSFPGSETLQNDYLSELATIAKKDHYEFVIWFIAVDYDQLYKKLPPGNEWKLMWMNAGLFDQNLKAKPAFNTWKQILSGKFIPKNLSESPKAKKSVATSKPSSEKQSKKKIQLGFTKNSQLYDCPQSDVSLGNKQGVPGMVWQFSYEPDWIYCRKEFNQGTLKKTQSLSITLNSDKEGAVLLKLEENNGESFFFILWPDKTPRKLELNYSNLNIDTDSKKNGIFEPEKVTSITFADANGMDNYKGNRRLFFSNFNAY